MIILIDAYNVLKQALHHHTISERERTLFLQLLGLYVKQKKHTILVVFDAGPYQWVHSEQRYGLTVVFSGAHATADDYIIGYMAEHRHKELLLVSSDYELMRYADTHMIASIDAIDFYALVQSRVHADKGHRILNEKVGEHVHEESAQSLDQLMRDATVHVPIKEVDAREQVHEQMLKRGKQKKTERKLAQIVKKL